MTEECSKNLMSTLKIDFTGISNCIKNSFQNGEIDSENTILMQDKEKQKQLNLTYFPNVFIDGLIYKGSLDTTDLFLSICTAM